MRTRPRFVLAALLATLLGGGVMLHAQSNDVAARAEPSTSATNVASTNAAAPASSAPTNHPAAATVAEKAEHPKVDSKTASSSGKTDFSSFRIVGDRNIFNGNRGSGSGIRFNSTRSSTGQRSVQIEWFTLVGTLVSSRGMTAFFDGSSSDFQTTLRIGEKFGGFTVKEILHAGVCLLQGTNEIELAVGSGMRREDQGLWKHSESSTSVASSWSGGGGPDSSSRSSDNGFNSRSRSDFGGRSSRSGSSRDSGRGNGNESSSSGSSSSSVGNPSAGDVDAVLKRLMEQRAKE